MPKTTVFNFEKAYSELEKIMAEVEKNEDLEKSLKLYEKGLDLISKCKKRLEEVENRVKVIREKFGE